MTAKNGTGKRKRVVLLTPLYPDLTYSSECDVHDIFYCIPLGLYTIKALVDNSPLCDDYEIIIAGREISQNFGDYALLKWVLSNDPSIVGLGSYVWNEMRNDTLAAGIKAASPHTRIVGGGPRFLHGAGEFLKDNADYDYIIVGEGEETFTELLHAVSSDETDFSHITGLVWRGENDCISNRPRPLIEPLDTIPSPYLTGAADLHEWMALGTESMRGCPWNCAYCAWSGFSHVQPGSRVRHFRMDRVLAEFEMASDQKIKIAYFNDPDFLANKKRAIKLCEAVSRINKNHAIRIFAEMRAETVDEDVAEALRSAGVKSASVGIQSIYPEITKIAERNDNLDRVTRGIKALLSKGIEVPVGLIVGLPGDDGTSGPKTIQYIESLGAKVTPFLLYVVPGSRFWKEADAYNLKFADYPPYFITDNSVIGKSEIAGSLAECYRSMASYEHRRWTGM